MMEDYCDSMQYKEHPLFSSQFLNLQVMLYYDEVELCNPLGSKRKKHKIGELEYNCVDLLL